jgi:hypothetical protein
MLARTEEREVKREKRDVRIENGKQNAIQIGLKTRNTQQPETEKGGDGRSD